MRMNLWLSKKGLQPSLTRKLRERALADHCHEMAPLLSTCVEKKALSQIHVALTHVH